MATYIEEMEAVLKSKKESIRKGSQVQALKAGAPMLYEIIDGEISLAVNKMTHDTPLEYNEYLSLHGQVVGIRRIRNLMDSAEVEEKKAADEAQAIEDNIALVQNGS